MNDELNNEQTREMSDPFIDPFRDIFSKCNPKFFREEEEKRIRVKLERIKKELGIFMQILVKKEKNKIVLREQNCPTLFGFKSEDKKNLDLLNDILKNINYGDGVIKERFWIEKCPHVLELELQIYTLDV